MADLPILEQPMNTNNSAGRFVKGRSLEPILNDQNAEVKTGIVIVCKGQIGLGYGYRINGNYRYVEWFKKGEENF